MAFERNLLANKVVLVTGASRGIGRGLLAAAAKAGAKVIGTATTVAGAEAITQYCVSEGYEGKGLPLQVCNQQEITAVLESIKALYGPVSILINNAAVTADNLILRMKDDQWENVIDTDLTAIFRLMRAVLRDMLKARWGRIINIGSVVGSIGNPGQANYCAAKAGLLGLTKSIALEVGSRNITINTVAPGYIATDMTNKLTKEQQESIFNRIPMQRVGAIEEVAAAVLFLASEQASYITGQTLHVNGGMYMA